MVNHIEFSQKIKQQYPQYENVDDRVLAEKMLEKYPQYRNQVTFDDLPNNLLQGKVEKSVNLTPSGILNGISNSVSSAVTAPLTAFKNKLSLKEAFLKNKEQIQDFKNNDKFGKANDFLLDTAVYGTMPEVRALQGFKGANFLNRGLTGAYQGASIAGLESLKNNGADPKDSFDDIKSGSLFGASLSAGLPHALKGAGTLADKIGKPLLETGLNIARVPIEFAQQAIKPGSNAIKLTPQAAQQLLTETTSRVQNNYKDLVSKRGREVGTAVSKLNQNKQRVPINDLQKSLEDIYKSYSFGGKVNYAENLAGSTKQTILDLLEQARPVTNINTDALPVYTGDKHAYNKAIKELYKQNVQGKSIIHPEVGKTDFFGDGFKKSVGSIADDIDQMALAPQIAEIYQKSKYQYNEPVYKIRRDKITDFDVMLAKAKLNNKPIDVEIKIANDENGKRYFLHRSPQENKALSNNKVSPSPNLDFTGQPGDNNIITDNEAFFNSIAPADLYDVTKQLGKMTNWNNPDTKLQNQIIERVYGDYSNKLSSLSPELAQANKAYSDLKNFQKNDGIRKILRKDNDIDTASAALRNYNSTITKGNTNKNINDLENMLVNEGYEPFINQIDDINAVEVLNRKLETGDSTVSNLSRNLAVKPALRVLNILNKNGLIDNLYKGLNSSPPSWLMPVLMGIKEKN